MTFPQSIPFSTCQKYGDVILVTHDKFLSLNLLFQSLLTGEKARFSHVLLCVVPGLYVHSTPKGGVNFLAAEDTEANFPIKYGNSWRVIRHQRLENDIALAAMVPARATFYLGQKYNWAFQASRWVGTKRTRESSFCSELVARVYQDLGIAAFQTPKLPSKTLPADFDRAAFEEGWRDITEEYRDSLNLSTPISHFFNQDIDPSDPSFFAIDPRLIYIHTVLESFESMKLRNDLARAVEVRSDLMKSFAEIFPSLSKDQKQDIVAHLGLNPRSLKQHYTNLLDVLFAASKSLFSDALAKKKNPVSFRELPRSEVDWAAKLTELECHLRDIGLIKSKAAVAIASATESIMYSVSILEHFPPATQEEKKESVRESVREVRAVIDSLEEYDRYQDEVRELIETLKMRLMETPLLLPRALTIFTMIESEMWWRLALIESPIRKAFDDLRRDPENFEAAYTAHVAAIRLAPLPGTTESI